MKEQSPEGASPQPEDAEPYERVLEFVRAEQADSPYAFHFKQQDYRLRTEGGAARNARFPWNEHLLADLETLAQEPPDPDAARRDLPCRLAAREAAADDRDRHVPIPRQAERLDTRLRVAVVAGAPGRRPAARPRPFLAGAPSRAFRRPTASSSVSASTTTSFGTDALVVPSVTYGP